MEYTIIMRCAVNFVTDFDRAAAELSDDVNAAIQEGWEPLGGVCACQTQSTHAPYLMQAMVRRSPPPPR